MLFLLQVLKFCFWSFRFCDRLDDAGSRTLWSWLDGAGSWKCMVWWLDGAGSWTVWSCWLDGKGSWTVWYDDWMVQDSELYGHDDWMVQDPELYGHDEWMVQDPETVWYDDWMVQDSELYGHVDWMVKDPELFGMMIGWCKILNCLVWWLDGAGSWTVWSWWFSNSHLHGSNYAVIFFILDIYTVF